MTKHVSADSAAGKALIASAATAGYEYGNSRATARAALVTARNSLDQSAYADWVVRFKAGRIVSYFENPPKAQRVHCANYLARRWDNLPHDQRVESAIEMMGKAAPTSEKPNRRTETEHKAVRAAETCVSELKRDAGLTKSNPKKSRKPRAPEGSPEGASVTVASPKFTNDNQAVEFFGNVAAALLATCEKNKQTGAPKSVKQIIFRVESLALDFKRQIEAALNSGK